MYTKFKKYRKRWEGKQGLANVIAWILKGGEELGQPENAEEISNRYQRVNEILKVNLENYEVSCSDVLYWKAAPVLASVPDLRGVNWSELNLKDVVIPGLHLEGAVLDNSYFQDAYIYGAHLEGAELRGIHLEGAFLTDGHLEGAYLHKAHLERAILTGAHLEGAFLHYAHLEGTILDCAHLEGANLSRAHLEGAVLIGANLEGATLTLAHLGGADLNPISVGRVNVYDDSSEIKSGLEETRPGYRTIFAYTEFLPRWSSFLSIKFINGVCRNNPGKKLWPIIIRFIFERWFFTDFGNARIDDADTALSPDLYRYVKDQQYLTRIRQRNKILYRLWQILAGCGNNIYLLAIWCVFFVWVFSLLYWSLPWQTPDFMHGWIPSFLYMAEKPINPEAYVKHYPAPSEAFKWFFVSFDIFSNLGIRNTFPQNNIGVLLVFFETALGYLALGTLLAIAHNKWVRRAG